MDNNALAEKGFPHQAARGSWICPLLIVVVTAVGNRLGNRLLVEFGALALMCIGMLLAIIAFCGIPKYGMRGILGQAIAGVILNGLLLTIFVTNFLAARAWAGH
jgi:hypothetical protein